MLIYTAGKYTVGDLNENIDHARKVSAQLWEMGHAVICPHSNTSHFEEFCKATYEQYITGDLNMISRCDAIVMLIGWEESPGANRELQYAQSLNIPIYFEPDLPTLHPTELKNPLQCKSFREITGEMYRLHLKKNADYSSANILGTGEIGLMTRLWDKIARLMNLYGFCLNIVEPSKLDVARLPKSESIEDSFYDAAVYSIIGLLLRRGIWGK